MPDRPEPFNGVPTSIYSPAEQVAWYATLPTLFGTAAALFTSPAGRVLLVKPNYRNHWTLPGGMLEQSEPPHEGCRREVEEEIGLQITPGPLLAVGWVPADDIRPRPMVTFLFDGGELEESTPIRLQESELDEYRFVDPGDVGGYLPLPVAARVTAALRNRAAGGAAYLPQPPA